jgi:alpha-galactosidase
VPQTISTTAAATGLPSAGAYLEHNLWTGKVTETGSTVEATVPANSAVLLRVSAGVPAGSPPATDLSAPQVPATPGSQQPLVLPGEQTTVRATFRDTGREPVSDVRLSLTGPDGWTVSGGASPSTVAPGSSLTATWQVTPARGALPGTYVLSDSATYAWAGSAGGSLDGQVSVAVPPTPPAGAGYLSDDTWLQASSGWRVPMLDQSVGTGPIRMGGTTYAKGIGVASVSRIDYYLGGTCTRLTGVAGIDDAVNNVGPQGGTATFTVSGDGEQRFGSGLVDRSATRSFDVDLTGVNVLSLQVGDGGDGTYNDRADWAGLQLTCGAAPVSVPAGSWPAYVAQSTVTATATSAHDGYPASAAVDGKLSTIWHDEFSPQAPLPQAITLDLGATHSVYGLTYQPRLDGSSTGTITTYRVEASTDGTSYSPVAGGTWADDSSLKSVSFQGRSARFIRLIADAGDGGYASAAEIRAAATS